MNRQASFYAFSVFTYDPEAKELRRNERRLRISEQSARLLELLLASGGALISRQAMREALWPDGAPFDYEHSINKAVSQLRMILRDKPKSPSMIETISKRGYRFIAPLVVKPPKLSMEQTPPRAVESAAVKNAPSDVLHPVNPTLLPASPAPQQTLSITLPSKRRRLGSAVYRWVLLAVLVVLVSISLYLLYERHSATQVALPSSITVGVVPFEVSGASADQLAESFRMDLIDAVGQLPGVQVRAAHSFRSAQQDNDSVRALAQSLDLDELIFGKLKIDGDRYTLQMELVHGRDATHQASLRYSGLVSQIGQIRERVRQDLYLYLKMQKSSEGMAAMHGTTDNAEAYQHYLRARFLLAQRVDASVSQSIEEFQSAILLDPGFAKAYAGAANAHVVLAEHGNAPFSQNYQQAETLVRKALSLDPQQAEAIALQGYIDFRYHWDLQSASQMLRKAIDLEPGQAIYHIWYAIALTTMGEYNQAFHQIDLARAADPFWPAVYVTEAYVADAAQDFGRSLTAVTKLQELMPDWPLSWDITAWTYWNGGKYAKAIQAWRRMAQLEKDPFRQQLEERGLREFRRGGVVAYAKVRLDAIEHHSQQLHDYNDFVPEEWYAYANEPAKAVKALRHAIDLHQPTALEIGINPAFTALHTLPEYQALVKRVGVPVVAPSSR